MQIRRRKWRGIKIGREFPQETILDGDREPWNLISGFFHSCDAQGKRARVRMRVRVRMRASGRRRGGERDRCFWDYCVLASGAAQRGRRQYDGNVKGDLADILNGVTCVCDDRNKENRFRYGEEAMSVSPMSGGKSREISENV